MVNDAELFYPYGMIISPGRRFIFVHIPKTGGTALSLALENRAMKDDILIGDTPKAQRRRRRVKQMSGSGRLWKHSRISDIQGLVSDHDIAEYFVFTLVRNPWDRMVSYYHWLRDQKFDHSAVSVAREHRFSDFLAHPHTLRSIGTEEFRHYMQAQNGTEHCDLYIRIEHLASDVKPLESHLGFSLGAIERVNQSKRDIKYQTYYTPSDRDLVGRLFDPDIRRFGYSYEP